MTGALRRAVTLLAASLAGCAAADPARLACAPLDPGPAPGQVALLSHGWHTDLALPASGLTGRLASFRLVFPGLRVLVIGFGRRSFMTAPVHTPADLLVGPFPGSGTVLAVGLDADVARAYADGTVVRFDLDRAAASRLDRFVAASLDWNRDGTPRAIGGAPFAGGVFYASPRTYSGFDTCNTWTVDALRAAGVPVSAAGVVFASQAVDRATAAGGAACRIEPAPAAAADRHSPPGTRSAGAV